MFFQRQRVYHDFSHCCGIPKLAKKLNQILVQHIKAVLPGLKSRINSQLVAVAKEYAAYGDFVESKDGQGVKLFNILTKYCEAFTSMIEGKNEELSTTELFGGSRIHYIFQTIFVKSLEELDCCDDVCDEDIHMTILNASGLKSSLFVVPEVSFEVLIRRKIGRLLDPSLQCARFVYDELIKMSHHRLTNELHQFPVLSKCMVKVIRSLLQDGLQAAEKGITYLIGMEMGYINTSHRNFIGGNMAVKIAQQHVKASRLAASVLRPKDDVDVDKVQASEKSQKSRAILARAGANVVVHDQSLGVRPISDSDRSGSAGSSSGSRPIWGISSIFGVSENRAAAKEMSSNNSSSLVPCHIVDHSVSMIQLGEPPIILKPAESQLEQEALKIPVTKLLLKSYYDIVRNNIEDAVPKAIMHSLVNHTKRELQNVFIKKFYRENLYDEMLREPGDIAAKRQRIRKTLKVLQQAYKTLDELPLEADTVYKNCSLDSYSDSTGSPKAEGLPSSFYSA